MEPLLLFFLVFFSIFLIFWILYQLEPYFWKSVYKFRYYKTKIFLKEKGEIFLNDFNHLYNLNFEHSRINNTNQLLGKYKSFDIGILYVRDEDESSHFEIKIYTELPTRGKLTFNRKYPDRKILGGYGWNYDSCTGYNEIDKRFFITTDDTLFLIAVFGFGFRKYLKKLFGKSMSLTLDYSGVTLDIPLYNVMQHKILAAYLDNLILLTEDVLSDDLKNKLLLNVTKRRKEEIKIKSINELGMHYGDEEDVQSIFKELLALKTLKNLDIKLAAALYLQDEGVRFSLNILKNTKYLGVDKKKEIVKIIDYNNYSEAIDILVKLYKETTSSDLKVMILETLNKFNYEVMLPFLLDEYKLQRNKDLGIKLRLAEMIVSYGDKSLIKEIKSFVKNLKPDLLPDDLQNVIIKIEAKLEKAKGMLSKSDYNTEEGKLSMPEDDLRGSLSK